MRKSYHTDAKVGGVPKDPKCNNRHILQVSKDDRRVLICVREGCHFKIKKYLLSKIINTDKCRCF